MFLLRLNRVLVIGDHTIFDGIGEETLFFLRIVKTGCGADMQSLDGVDIQEHITEDTPIDIAVVFVALQDRQGVLALRKTAGRRSLSQLAVRVIDRQKRMVLKDTLDIAAGSSYFRSTVEREVLADGHNIFQHLIVSVNTRRETVEVSRLDNTVVLVVAE